MKIKFCLKASVVAVLASCALPVHAVVFPALAPTPPGATVYTPMTLDFTKTQSTLGGNTLTVSTIAVNPANAVVLDRTYGGITNSMHFVLQGGAVNFITGPYSPLSNSVPMTGWMGSSGWGNCQGCMVSAYQNFDAGLMNPLLAFSSNGQAISSTSTGTLFSTTVDKGAFLSIGSLTPAASIPLLGSAVYTGVLDGRMAGNSAGNGGTELAATLTLTANFALRSVAFATTNSFVYDWAAPVGVNPLTVNPNANLTGTLTYLAGSNTFSGAVATPLAGGYTGTAQGRFYGLAGLNPAEAGGLVGLSNAVTGQKFAGSFGAKTGLPAQSVPAGKTLYYPLVANFTVANDPLTGALLMTTQAVTVATAANSISLYRLPAGLGTVGMDYSFTSPSVIPALPAVVFTGQAAASGLNATAIETSASGMMGAIFDGSNKWLPTTGTNWMGGMGGIAMQSAAPAKTYNYSDFGMWSAPPAGMPGVVAGLFQAGVGQFLSVGAPTVAANIPVTGSATYAGTAVGYYQGAPVAAVAPAVGTTPAPLQLLTANVAATANFVSRTMAWTSTATQLTSPGVPNMMTGMIGPNTVAAAPTLNMTANLAWLAGANAFSGVAKAQGTGTALLPALSGTVQGRFYGPVAGLVGATKPLEIGGVFNLNSVAGAKMAGAFGAK